MTVITENMPYCFIRNNSITKCTFQNQNPALHHVRLYLCSKTKEAEAEEEDDEDKKLFEWSEEERGSRKKHICWNRKKVEAKKFEDVEMSTLSDAQERWVDKKWRLEARKNPFRRYTTFGTRFLFLYWMKTL